LLPRALAFQPLQAKEKALPHTVENSAREFVARWLKRLIVLGLICAAVLAVKIYSDTMRDPVVQKLTIASERLPAGSKPITIALLADIHIAGPDMPPSRLEEIVAQVNALQPDLVAIAGDLVSEKRVATHIYTAEEIVAPLGELKATHGVVFAPGNHDYWFDWDGLAREMRAQGNITILINEARQFGPLAIGGIDDVFTRRDDVDATMEALMPLQGPRIVVTHSPDVFPQVWPGAQLVLAGHTHCGQIAYPWGNHAPATMSDYGDLYACGIVEENNKTLVTSAGIGTSLLPMRLFTQPEIWLIEIKPE
jgi:predicted MPP superfamily phosphohydrolase